MENTNLNHLRPVEYLTIGHITQDMTPTGLKFGGTATYASLTAKAIGLEVGIVTACEQDLLIPELDQIQIVRMPSECNSTFENIQTPNGRIQYIHKVAPVIKNSIIPFIWRDTPIVHFGPIAQEIEPQLIDAFPNSFIGMTPQGWLRSWDDNGRIHPCPWKNAKEMLKRANATVLSIEDIGGDESIVEEMASTTEILVITEAAAGARLYWNGDVRRFYAPKEEEVDATGAGDIFATAFFIRLNATKDPWEAARYATQLASLSVTRPGILGVPTAQETQEFLIEII